MNKEPLVSVIIPNYNHANYLDSRIKSVLSQTYTNYEVIILDDCSSDNSMEIIHLYESNPHISSIIVNDKNVGIPFIQWHKGMMIAKGSLIWIAESDDSCEPYFLDNLVKTLEEEKDCALAFCKMIAFTNEGKKWVMTSSDLSEGYYDSVDFINKFLALRNSIVNASGVIFRKEIALSIDPIYMKLKGVGDWMFWIELAERGRIAYVDKSLSYFRQHDNNMTKSNVISGVNTYDRKLILDYIQTKGYIDNDRYKEIKERIITYEIFSLPSRKIRFKLLNHWEPSFLKRVRIVTKIYYNHIIWLIKSSF